MLFNSFQYLVFLPVVVALYWVLPRRARPLMLLIASYYFYMSWLKSYGLLLGGMTLVNYLLGLAIARTPTAQAKRLLLVGGLAANLGCLALYKYTNFLIEAAWQALGLLDSYAAWAPAAAPICPSLPIILPLGISFFVFEFIHYLVDVYRGSKPIISPIRFGLFAAFFPSQIAGPIKRYQDFDHQLSEPARFEYSRFQQGMWLILQGMFKKVALGDNLALIVQAGFAQPALMGTLDAWICTIAFALQIYFDFSGYTDIGRGSAMLLGFQLPENFNLPYVARNLSDFWRRWHISLSTWLRDYLFIPLGGSRGGALSTTANLLVTMLLGGLWHGASWHFVIWGGYHGVGLAATHWWQSAVSRIPALAGARKSPVYDLTGRLFTFFLVLVGWVIFRADSVPQALGVYSAMFTLRLGAGTSASVTGMFFDSVLPVALTIYGAAYLARLVLATRPAAGFIAARLGPGLAFWLTPPAPARVAAYLGIAVMIFGLAASQSMPFIYFQF